MQRVATPLLFTSLHALEVRNGIYSRQYRGDISAADSAQVLTALDADLAAGVWTTTTMLWAETLQTAHHLSRVHTSTIGSRSLDILHVAAALTLGAKTFLTFDTRQRAVAQAEGLRVKP